MSIDFRGLSTELMVDPERLLAFLAVSLCIVSVLVAFRPKTTGERLELRRQAVANGTKTSRPSGDHESERRRRRVEDTLRELQSKERSKRRSRSRPTLVGRMRQAGIGWSRNTYLLVSVAAAGAGIAVALLAVDLGLVTSIGFGLASGLLLPHSYVAVCRSRRLRRFAAEFPNALDTIVRGVQAGLPLADGLKTIASDAQEPVRTEFRTVIDDQAIGLPLEPALQRLCERVPLSETNFFAIVLTIQSRTGGNLSEALTNLSTVLRDRKKMRLKIAALSSEAKASSAIIGALPVAVAGMLYTTSPEYIELLFTTPIGRVAIACSAVWMLLGCLVMRKMINFDF